MVVLCVMKITEWNVPNTHEAELYLTLVPEKVSVPEEVSSGQTMNEKWSLLCWVPSDIFYVQKKISVVNFQLNEGVSLNLGDIFSIKKLKSKTALPRLDCNVSVCKEIEILWMILSSICEKYFNWFKFHYWQLF